VHPDKIWVRWANIAGNIAADARTRAANDIFRKCLSDWEKGKNQVDKLFKFPKNYPKALNKKRNYLINK